MIELQTDYIKDHSVNNPRMAEIRIIAEEDYDPRRDGFHCHLLSFSEPLSMPQDNDGTSDIDTLMFHLIEAVNIHDLTPNTEYRITMIECEEYDGSPILMQTWAIQEVITFDLALNIVIE